MVWTLLLFGISMYVLAKLAFPRITEALDRRQKAIEDSIDAADRIRAGGRRAAGRVPRAAEGGARARRRRSSSAPARRPRTHEREAEEEAKAKREQMMEQTRRDIEAETRRAIQEIRREVADLTVMATEKVTRKTLTEEDQRRLVEEALSRAGLQRAERGGAQRTSRLMEEIAQVYARALFEVAIEQDVLDECASSSGSSPTPCTRTATWRCSSSRPTSRSTEKKDALQRAVLGRGPGGS